MRDELRLMKPKYIENNIGVSSVYDLLELSESNLKQSFVSTSLKFIKQQNESVKKQPEQLDTILDLFIHLIQTTGRQGRKERILTFLNTSNNETTFFTQRKLFYQVVQEYASSKSLEEWKSKQNKSNWIKRELETFDEMARNQNMIRRMRTKESDKSLNTKLDEYRAKFLVA
jgi:carboxylesterase type B